MWLAQALCFFIHRRPPAVLTGHKCENLHWRTVQVPKRKRKHTFCSSPSTFTVLDQAEGERLAGIAQKTPSGQNINCCVNKGQCFEGLIEHDPSVVQGGPLLEQLVTEALGENWICTSLIASISLQGGVPQALHQDQGRRVCRVHERD